MNNNWNSSVNNKQSGFGAFLGLLTVISIAAGFSWLLN